MNTTLLTELVGYRNEKPRVQLHRVEFKTLPVLVLPWMHEQPLAARTPNATFGRRVGITPGNKGKVYPAQPLTDPEALAIADAFPTHPAGTRDRALWITLWRSGLRIQCEALKLMAGDLNPMEGTVYVACGKGSKARTVPMDPWAWEQIAPWLALRAKYPEGPIFCVTEGPTKGIKAIGASQYRSKLHEIAELAGVHKRVHPHGARHTLACNLVLENIQVPLIQRQLGHASPGTTGIYLAGLPVGELFDRVAQRPAPKPAAPAMSLEEMAVVAAGGLS